MIAETRSREILSCKICCVHVAQGSAVFVGEGCCCTGQVDMESDLREMYKALPWGDTWDDAHMRLVIFYIRGSKQLRIPDSWRSVLPTYVPVSG